VTAHDVTLDASATPRQVVYVLLRALADDVRAAQDYDRDAQKAAMDLAYSLAAYSTIERRLLATVNLDGKEKQTSLGDQRNQKLFEFTKMWAPIVAHYIDSFDTTFEDFAAKAWVLTGLSRRRAHVFYDVCHDPAETDPAKRQTATIDVELAEEKAGGQSYWRVARIDYLGRTRAQPAIVEAFGQTLDETAGPEQVAYVLLRALAREVELARNGTRNERRAAMMLTFSLAAHDIIEQRLLADVNKDRPEGERAKSLGPNRDGEVLRAITAIGGEQSRWAQMVAPYVQDLDAVLDKPADLEAGPSGDGRYAHVLCRVPPGEAETQPARGNESVMLDVVLAPTAATEKGPLWRVVNVGCLLPRPASVVAEPPAPDATAPAPASTTAPAPGE